MREIISRIGRLSAGEYGIEDVLSGVQVGWINRDESDNKWYILDNDYQRKAGPFDTLAEANSNVEDVLGDKFGIGSPAN